MNPTTETPIQTAPKAAKKRAPWPIIGAVAGAGLLAFVAGRSTAPNPPANMGTNQAGQSGLAADEHAEGKEHKEGEEHAEGEAGHGAGHAEGEAGHGEEGHKEGEAESETIVFEGDSAREAGVTTQTVALEAQTVSIPFNGAIEASPDRVVRVSSVVPGRITRLLVGLGDQVQRGQTLAVVESRAIGEAQSAYQQASARLGNARSNFQVVNAQARAGVFARAPLEASRRALTDAQADVRNQEITVRQARAALENATRLARAGSYAAPALEAARNQAAAAQESLRTAGAALSGASAATRSARSELARRRQLAAGGAYVSRPVQEARRALVAAQSARAAAQSEVATTRANLARARSLAAEGLVSTRDLEAAQQAFETATARLQTTGADELAARQELERQQKLSTSNVAGVAEVGAAQSALAAAEADVRTRAAEVIRAREGVRVAESALTRERTVFGGNIANRREISGASSILQSAQSALLKARQTLRLAQAASEREGRIFRQGLNNTAQVQTARAALLGAQSDLSAARSALELLQSAPGGRASVPILAPISGRVQERPVARGEVISADTPLMTIADLRVVHLDMFVPEREISRVKLGTPVTATLDALPGRTFTGQIELVHSEVDPKTRTVETHAEIRNPGDIKPGMFARGRIQTALAGAALAVPAEAIQDLEGEKMVFVQGDEAGHFEKRAVEIGATQGGRTLIKSGLKAGEKIVVKGAFTVKAQAMKAELGHDH